MFNKPVLVVGAHPDDIEIYAGGTVAHLISAGVEVHTLTLSGGEYGMSDNESNDFDYALNTRGLEHLNALKTLGLKVGNMHFSDFKDTKIGEHLNDVVRAIEGVLVSSGAQTIITHFPYDSHQDHVAVGQASIAAARNIDNILFFQPSWPSGRTVIPFTPNLTVRLNEDSLNKKIQAISKHRSQIAKYGDQNYLDSVKAQAQSDLLKMAGAFNSTIKGAELFYINRVIAGESNE